MNGEGFALSTSLFFFIFKLSKCFQNTQTELRFDRIYQKKIQPSHSHNPPFCFMFCGSPPFFCEWYFPGIVLCVYVQTSFYFRLFPLSGPLKKNEYRP